MNISPVPVDYNYYTESYSEIIEEDDQEYLVIYEDGLYKFIPIYNLEY